METRSEDRVNLLGARRLDETDPASMETRSEDRVNFSVRGDATRGLGGFNGDAVRRPRERLPRRAGAGARHASMETRSEDRVNISAARCARVSYLLQWRRGPKTA